MRRLGRVLSSVLLLPLLHLVYALLLCIREGIPAQDFFYRVVTETTVIAALPLALERGRFPTSSELMRTTPAHYAVMGITVALFWFAGSLLIRTLWLRMRRAVPGRWLAIALGVGLVLLLLWTIQPLLPTPATALLRVDAADGIGAMPTHQRAFSQGGEGQMPEAGYFEAAMEQLTPLRPRLVRIDHLYDYYNVYSVGDDGTPVYDWQQLDRIVDAILASGAAPLMTLSYAPPALARQSVYAPPSDLDQWEALVYETVYHYNVERGLNIRYWEVWNEPNHGSFWAGSAEDYLALYAASVRGARRADPTVLIGGPAVATTRRFGSVTGYLEEGVWVRALIRYVQEHDLPLDFVSWHLYDTRPQAYRESIEEHQAFVAGFDPPPQLLLTEWNWSAGFAPALDNGDTVAYVAQMVATFSDSALDQAFFFEPIDGTTAWEGRWGMLREDGSVKPVYNAFRLLGELSGERLRVESTHPNVGGLASRHGNVMNLAVWNYHSGHAVVPVTISFNGLPPNAEIVADIQGVDREHGNSFYGSDDNLLIGTERIEVTQDGQASLALDVPENGICLVTLPLIE